VAAGLLAVAGSSSGPPAPSRDYPATGIVLLSLKDGALRGSASVGTDPVAVVVSADGKTAYTADSAPGDVYAVGLPGLEVIWKTHVGGSPFGLLLHGGRLFVSLFDTTAVVELDTADGSMLATDPVPQGPAALTTDGAGDVVVAGTHGQLTVIGGKQLKAGNGFAVALTGGVLWSADYERAELVPAGDDHRVGMPVPLFPFWLAPAPGSTLLIAAEGGTEDTDPGGVFSFDTRTGAFKTLATPKDPDQVLQSGSAILVAAHGDRDVLAIQAGRTSIWALGAAAVALAPDPSLDLAVVAVNAHE
jgi:DNA-binding beta-propeller fold protein YncE